MRTFDRAMYAMFLLVLLADVARAGAVVPGGASGGLTLGAAAQVRVSPEDGGLQVILASGRGQARLRTLRFATKDRALAQEFLINYRAALRRTAMAQSKVARCGLTQAGPLRSLFDQLCMESGSSVASLQGMDDGSLLDSRMFAEFRSTPILEHAGNPAP